MRHMRLFKMGQVSLLLVVLLGASSIGPSSAALAMPAQTSVMPRIGEGVVTALQDGPQRVIIMLHDPVTIAADLEVREQAVAAAQQTVLDVLAPEDFELIHQ
jgi:hypothetical protein